MPETNCLFCGIISGKIPAKVLKNCDKILAFYDVNPCAPYHVLIIPKEHIRSVNQVTSNNSAVFGDMLLLAQEIARENLFDKSGYRLVINTEPKAGQSVFHLHVHMLAGREFSWPPG